MKLLALIALAGLAHAQETAETIMARVAENQDRAEAARAGMVYEQDVVVRLHRSNRKLAREESYQYVVTPTPTGISKEQKAFKGKYEKGGQYIEYTEPGFEYKEMDIDGELAHDLAEDMTNDKTRDGLSADLFPLRKAEMRKYRFALKGREQYRGQDVYVVRFDSKEKGFWTGEALIHAQEFQPVLITTWMARGLPLVVKTLLGTDLKHLGFKLGYEKLDDGVWMPVSYGGELRLRAVFVYRRNISISMRNTGFRRAKVDSSISYDLESASRQ